MIHCEPGHNVVRAYPVQSDGAGFTAEIVDVLKSSEQWVRPSDVCVAPDGSLLIADWYDAGVGGHAMAERYELRVAISCASVRGRHGHKPKRSLMRYNVDIGRSQKYGHILVRACLLKCPQSTVCHIAWPKRHQSVPLIFSAEAQLGDAYNNAMGSHSSLYSKSWHKLWLTSEGVYLK